jgi:hypothetical protein
VALDCSTQDYRLSSLRYDLSKLRAKGLVEKLPHSRRYRLRPEGYSICLVFLKLFERIYARLTAGLLQPLSPDNKLQQERYLNSTSSTNGSSRLSTISSTPLASKPPETQTQREQTSRYNTHNRLKLP